MTTAFGGRAPSGLAGEASNPRSPRPFSRNRETCPTFKGTGEGERKGEGIGNGKRRDGGEEERK